MQEETALTAHDWLLAGHRCCRMKYYNTKLRPNRKIS
jgi:hypothetical protein